MSKSNSDQLKPETYTRLRGCSPGLCRSIAEWLSISAHDRVLDLGCGPGENTALISAFSEARVEGLDLDTDRIRFAQASHPALTFHHANAEDLPLKDGCFGAIVMMLSIQRFVNRAKVLDQVRRVLATDGRIGIATVSPEQLAARPDFRHFPTALEIECGRFPSIVDLQGELAAHGFSEIQARSFREVIRPLDGTFVRWLEDYPFTVFRKIPEHEFQSGLQAIREHIAASPTVQLLTDEYTVITAKKL